MPPHSLYNKTLALVCVNQADYCWRETRNRGKKIKLNQLKSRTYSKIAYTKAYNAPHSLIYNLK